MIRTLKGREQARGRRPIAVLALLTGVAALAVTGLANPAASSTSTPQQRTEGQVAAPSAAPVVRHFAGGASHRVAAGETLTGIAARYGTTISALVAANGISDPNLIRSGTSLSIPGPSVVVGGGGGGQEVSTGLPRRLRQSPTRLAYVSLFDKWAAANGIPPDLLKAMTWLESGWQNGVVSSTGAVGIGQLMPDTVDHMEALIGVDLDPSVPQDNIRASARFVRWLLARFPTTEAAVAAYYQGPSSVARNGPFAETQHYVANVLALRARF